MDGLAFFLIVGISNGEFTNTQGKDEEEDDDDDTEP